jgi:phosphate starvation-inducible protein PhoH and related proteins
VETAAKGEHVGTAEVEAAMRLAEGGAEGRPPPAAAADLPAIRTRKGAIAPRSPGPGRLHGDAGAREMVFGIGPAGTGKTYLAVAQGVALLQAGRVDRIVLSRPAVEAGERLASCPAT